MAPSLLPHALAYAAQGWRVFALSGSKVPFRGTHGHLDATTDPDAIRAMWAKHPGANIGLAPDAELVIVDPDGPNALAQLLALAAPHGGLPATLAARTPRGGWHLYYRHRATRSKPLKCWAMRRAHKGDDGIDIKTAGGYVLLPPSSGRKGGYAWANVAPIAELPLWLADWVLEQAGTRSAPVVPNPNRPTWLPPLAANRRISEGAAIDEPPPAEDVAAALAVIPNTDRGWDDWNRIMMAVYAATAGAAWGLELVQRWSALSRKHSTDETAARWRHFASSPPTSIGYGTLVHEARAAQPGWVAPSQTPVEAPAEPEQASQETDAPAGVNGFHFEGEQTAKPKSNNPLIQLNEKYSVIGDMGGKCLVLSWVPSKADRRLKVPSFQSFKSFSERFGNRYVKINNESKPLGAYWLRWPGRNGFEGIDLVPNGPPVLENGALNLWGGFAVEARAAPAGWPLMRRHICEVLAEGDPEGAEYILRFAAWAVQHPGERAEVALVFRGGKGSGKGTFANALVRLFGQHGLQVFNSKHLVGAFNGHLRNCLLLFADEAFWAGDKQGESVLKGMLTERVLVIEQKGIDATLWENRLHVIMAANADWVVPASHDERRFAMFDVNPSRIGDRAYFDALHKELNGEGLGAMLFDLLHVDLAGWHPRQIVRTQALQNQKARSLSYLNEWWEGLLQDGRLPGITTEGPNVCPAATVLAHAREAVPKLKDVSANTLGRFLREQGGEGFHRNTGNFWKLLHLLACRNAWEAKFGKWTWRNNLSDWIGR